MKKKAAVGLVMIILFMFYTGLHVSALPNRAVTAALKNFSRDVARLPGEIRVLSVYPPERDKEGRLNTFYLESVLEQSLLDAGFGLADKASREAAFGEIKLGLQGHVDVASLKEAGRLSGADAILFTDYLVSGVFKNKLTVTVKAVEVATGTVVLAKEYRYEEPPPFNLGMSLMYMVYNGYTRNTTISVDNPSRDDWTYTESIKGFFPMTAEFILIGELPSIRMVVQAGVITPFAHQVPKIMLDDFYLTDYHYAAMDGGGVSNILRGFTPYAGLEVPVSWLFGDVKDRLRLKAGAAFLIYEHGSGGFGLKQADDEAGNTEPINWDRMSEVIWDNGNYRLMTVMIKTALSFYFLPNVAVFADLGIIVPWMKTTPAYQGIAFTHSGRGVIFSLGLTYKVF